MRFTIIGDGPLRRLVDDRGLAHRQFDIVHVGRLEPEDVDRLLSSSVDLLFAMGTSAIEGGKLGIPTVLLDIAYGSVPDGYVYRWLFEATEFGLGSMLSERANNPENDSLANIVAAVVRDRPALSHRTYEYCARNHSTESVAQMFTAAAAAAEYKYGRMSPQLRRKGAVRRVYERGRSAMTRRKPKAIVAGTVS